ncbi:hypothetical protein RhiirA5_422844 [Rhizophagus irregularis]|uniref:Uncharacterized protein n=1 Tax=Rhizophagus irregularis TaxID=588596 RepID=A0A2N0PB37_9GLOM|nr:hypothetical protein RhiirA5_422844 [Rhizophagus irregularis]
MEYFTTYYDENDEEYEEEWEEEDKYKAYVTIHFRSPISQSMPMDMDATAKTPSTKRRLVIVVIDNEAAVSIMMTAIMKTLILTIDGPLEYVIRTANKTRVRSLEKIQNLPLTVKNLLIKTNIQIIESDICMKSQTEIRRTNVIKHKIITENTISISQLFYKCNPKYRQFSQGKITRMEKQDCIKLNVIKRLASPWALPASLLWINNILESFNSNAICFTMLDLTYGYWQVVIDPAADFKKTAFITL